ncbi:hypothetical protein FOZ60_017163 [Perkinsus olseni]|uniref:Reverse transcriptase domain-containing protein n=1 Tax=Perkinsus olseni TaxID=32597 RepID=A0A7J6N1Q1_PEROL|nr:hypothetical protein FOZ60_017163 [Perkinsus olseni]
MEVPRRWEVVDDLCGSDHRLLYVEFDIAKVIDGASRIPPDTSLSGTPTGTLRLRPYGFGQRTEPVPAVTASELRGSQRTQARRSPGEDDVSNDVVLDTLEVLKDSWCAQLSAALEAGIFPKEGCRKASALGPFLFLLSTLPLVDAFAGMEEKGVSLTLYADDTTVVVSAGFSYGGEDSPQARSFSSWSPRNSSNAALCVAAGSLPADLELGTIAATRLAHRNGLQPIG